jgi:hypothetical protein
VFSAIMVVVVLFMPWVAPDRINGVAVIISRIRLAIERRRKAA